MLNYLVEQPSLFHPDDLRIDFAPKSDLQPRRGMALKRIFKIIAAIVIVLAIPAIIQKVMFGSKSDPAEALTKLASETNAGLPKRVDALTTLTRVEYDRKVWRVSYTMDKGAPIDPSQDDKYKNYAVKQICASDMRRMLDNNITIEYLYTYTDSSGQQNMRISIPPGSCV